MALLLRGMEDPRGWGSIMQSALVSAACGAQHMTEVGQRREEVWLGGG